MKTTRLFASLFVAVCTLVGARTASATSILITGNTSFTMNWLYDATDPDLSATATFTITNWSASSFDLTVTDIANTMPVSPDINARLVSFGLGLTPDATGTSNAIDGSDFSWGTSNFPDFQTVEICAYSGQNCSGGGNGGLNQGESSSDVLSITFSGPFTNGVTLSPIAARFQTEPNSYTFDEGECIGCEESFPPLATPEPASLVLLGTGLGLALFARKRRRS